jgi:hypothetical protein
VDRARRAARRTRHRVRHRRERLAGWAVHHLRADQGPRAGAGLVLDADRRQPPAPADVVHAGRRDQARLGTGRIAIIANADHQPDGTSANVATIRPDGSGLRLLTHFRGGEVNALTGSYSPDGRWIVYRLENAGTFALEKIRADGRGCPERIRVLPVAPRHIDWGSRG